MAHPTQPNQISHPDLEPGNYFFRGYRWMDADHRQYVSVRAYATIERAHWEPHPLLVRLDGGKTRFRLDRFQGVWTVVNATQA
jgi:hypothetical protein